MKDKMINKIVTFVVVIMLLIVIMAPHVYEYILDNQVRAYLNDNINKAGDLPYEYDPRVNTVRVRLTHTSEADLTVGRMYNLDEYNQLLLTVPKFINTICGGNSHIQSVSVTTNDGFIINEKECR